MKQLQYSTSSCSRVIAAIPLPCSIDDERSTHVFHFHLFQKTDKQY